jgi:hypothetical protein
MSLKPLHQGGGCVDQRIQADKRANPSQMVMAPVPETVSLIPLVVSPMLPEEMMMEMMMVLPPLLHWN